jgi:hypothetical protein
VPVEQRVSLFVVFTPTRLGSLTNDPTAFSSSSPLIYPLGPLVSLHPSSLESSSPPAYAC